MRNPVEPIGTGLVIGWETADEAPESGAGSAPGAGLAITKPSSREEDSPEGGFGPGVGSAGCEDETGAAANWEVGGAADASRSPVPVG